MGAPWILVKAFIREATENPDCTRVADVATVYARLREIQRGHFETSVSANGLIQTMSVIGNTTFAFAQSRVLDRETIMAVAETALELIEPCKTVEEIRALLVRVKSTRTDFSRHMVS